MIHNDIIDNASHPIPEFRHFRIGNNLSWKMVNLMCNSMARKNFDTKTPICCQPLIDRASPTNAAAPDPCGAALWDKNVAKISVMLLKYDLTIDGVLRRNTQRIEAKKIKLYLMQCNVRI